MAGDLKKAMKDGKPIIIEVLLRHVNIITVYVVDLFGSWFIIPYGVYILSHVDKIYAI